MTRDELKQAVERWNEIMLAKPFGRAIEGEAACDLLLWQLEQFSFKTVCSAINEEAMEVRPDILSRRFVGRCLQKQPPPREN